MTEIHSFAQIDQSLRAIDTGEESAKKRKLFASADLFENRPIKPREWLIENFIPNNTVTLLGGDGGSGKSLLAMMLAVSTAAAQDVKWVGRLPVQGPSIYVGAEDDIDEMHRRLSDINEASMIGFTDLKNMHICSLAGQDALLAVENPKTKTLQPTPLFFEIRDKIEAERPKLVVFDTLADLFGANENDRALARQFVGMLRGLAIQFQCAVVLLAHPSLSGMSSGSGTSGSTGWNNSVRSRLYLERITEDGYEPNHLARRLSVKKNNYGTTGDEITMTYDSGVFKADKVEAGLDKMASSAKAERVFLKLLHQVNEQGRRVNASAGVNFAPKLFSEMHDNEDVVKRGFKRAMEALLAKGTIKIVNDTSNKNRHRQHIEKVNS